MFHMLNVIVQADKLMNIFVVIASIPTKVLFGVRTFYNGIDDQVIRRPFVVFIRASDVNCYWATLSSRAILFFRSTWQSLTPE